LALLGAVALGPGGGEAIAAQSLYDVAKIKIDTTAKNAVAARANGMAEAQMRALTILLGRIVPLSVQAQLPEFSPTEAEELVMGVAVRKEQTSTTRYIATLDVRFNPYSVRQFLADYAIPITEEQAPAITILPVMLKGGGVAEDEGWRKAWDALDLANSITPATLARPQGDLDAATVKSALNGDADAYAALRSAYGYGGLVVAVGESEGGKLRVRVAGDDALGAVRFDQTYPANDVSAAAGAAFGAIEHRWKTTQEGGVPPGGVASVSGDQPTAETASAEVPRNVVALVEFTGLRDWQEIRSRLTQIAGLNALKINSMSARAAAVTFDFAGPLDRLQTMLGQNGFVLDERNGTLVLRSQ
jgi:uncharacterized protein DUF2066